VHASCVCLYVGVGVVSWTGGHPGVHVAQQGAPVHPDYAATRARRAVLRGGLDGMLLAVLAQPVGQVVRGFVVELLVRASQLEQQWAAVEQRVAMGHHGPP
jgi:hypothetical protein